MTFAATVQAEQLQAALAPVSTLVDECKLRTNADGVSITAVDPANVAMVDMETDASAFASYQADGGVLGSRGSDERAVLDNRVDWHAVTHHGRPLNGLWSARPGAGVAGRPLLH